MHLSLVWEKHRIVLQVGKSAAALRTLSCGHHLDLLTGGGNNLSTISFASNGWLTVSYSLLLLLGELMPAEGDFIHWFPFVGILNRVLDPGGECIAQSLPSYKSFSKSGDYMSHWNNYHWNQWF